MTSEKRVKREWVYVLPPSEYECTCDQCGSKNVTWSEYQNMLWCYNCERDVEGYSIFTGPVAYELCVMFLGQNCFDRIILSTGAYEKFMDKGNRFEWEHAYYLQPLFTTA